MANLVKNIFSKEDLDAIASAISDAENKTSGEIRVSIRQKRKWSERKLSIEEIARREFQLLGMANTKERNGLLIFILLEDKKFYIFADEGIHSKLEKEAWQKIADDMSVEFTQKHFRDGVIQGVKLVSDILSKHFPRNSNDVNELPNEVKVN